MPQVGKTALIFLQYAFLGGLYFFLYRVIKTIRLDLVRAQEPRALLAGVGTGNGEEIPPALQGYLVINATEENSGMIPGKRYALGVTTTIGRSIHNTIVVPDSYASAEHACISWYKNSYWLADLNSTNGTFHNGERLQEERQLSAGDMIKIGSVTFRFER